MKTQSIVFLVCTLFFSGCITVPTLTKVDMLSKPAETPFMVEANYIALAHYWDDYAEKQMIDFKGASFLTIREDEGRAEITIGNGPYYGMIELKKISDHSTRITSYAWGSMAPRIIEWQEILRSYPKLKKPNQH